MGTLFVERAWGVCSLCFCVQGSFWGVSFHGEVGGLCVIVLI